MTELKHTPGEWSLVPDTKDPHDTYWVTSGKKTVAQLFRVGVTIAEFEANARLIVAAPRMYEVLKMIAAWPCCGTPGCTVDDPCCDAMVARAVIAEIKEQDTT